jgi:hypothetical protein
MLSGVWVGAVDLAAAAAALALLFVPLAGGARGPRKRSHGSPRKPGLPGKRAGR